MHHRHRNPVASSLVLVVLLIIQPSHPYKSGPDITLQDIQVQNECVEHCAKVKVKVNIDLYSTSS